MQPSVLINLCLCQPKIEPSIMIHRGYDSCGIGVDGPTDDGSKTVLVKRKGDNDVLTRGIQGAFESGNLDPHRQIRRHVGLAHTRYLTRMANEVPASIAI